MPHDDKRHRHIQAIVRHTLHEHRRDLVLLQLGQFHNVGHPIIGMLHQRPDRQFAMRLVQFKCPRFQIVNYLEVLFAAPIKGNHLEGISTEGQHCQTGIEARTEIADVHLLRQTEWDTCIDKVPVDIKRAAHRIYILILLVVLLIVEGLQFKHALVDPRLRGATQTGIVLQL